MADNPLCLRDRIALRIEEAAETLGLSERAFREHLLPLCPKVYAGRSVVIPRRLFEQFLEQLALAEKQQTEETAGDLLASAESRLEKSLDESR